MQGIGRAALWLRGGASIACLLGLGIALGGCQLPAPSSPQTGHQGSPPTEGTTAASAQQGRRAACGTVLDRLRREDTLTTLRLTFDHFVPQARDILENARLRSGEDVTFTRDGGGRPEVQVLLPNVRDLEVPKSLSNTATYLDKSKTEVLEDRRSVIDELWRVDEATVVAADMAYDIDEEVLPDLRSTGSLDPEEVSRRLPDYDVEGIYVDTFTGFKGVALEKRNPAPGQGHRIYAAAGTQVFVNTDFRDWASGLEMARPHFTSDASLRMIADAAAYASDLDDGGEVFFTGQSQGALTSQGQAFLLQTYLNATGARHHLVHAVSWGAAGANEAIVNMIRSYRAGRDRDFGDAFERHWSFTDPGYAQAKAVWHVAASQWSKLAEDDIEAYVRGVEKQMRVVGFFFEIDPFARAGTFLGTSLVFPTAFVLPEGCQELVSELMFRTRVGKLGITLESHFLKGYERAVERGAMAVAQPANPEKWPWVMDLLPWTEVIGKSWLANIYRDRLGSSGVNWSRCLHSERWFTDRNRYCRDGSWPGCSPNAWVQAGEPGMKPPGPNWCLIVKGDVGAISQDPALGEIR